MCPAIFRETVDTINEQEKLSTKSLLLTCELPVEAVTAAQLPADEKKIVIS